MHHTFLADRDSPTRLRVVAGLPANGFPVAKHKALAIAGQALQVPGVSPSSSRRAAPGVGWLSRRWPPG